MVNKIIELYKTGLSTRDIEKELHINKKYICKILNEEGIMRSNIPIRDKYGRFHKKGKEVKERKKKHNTVYTYRNIINNSSVCSICNSTFKLEVHHIDKDRRNNNYDNLIVVCSKCHKTKIHTKNRDKQGRYIKG